MIQRFTLRVLFSQKVNVRDIEGERWMEGNFVPIKIVERHFRQNRA